MVESVFNVVDGIVIVNGIGGPMVASLSSGRCARNEAEVVGSGEVVFEDVPCLGCRRHGFPFREGSAVEACDL